MSEYRDLGRLEESDKIHIVRNQVDGRICVRKTVALEQWEIYNFLKENPNPYIPRIYECIQVGTELIVIMRVFCRKKFRGDIKGA